MTEIFKRLFYFLNNREKKIAILLLFLSLIVSFVELLSIISILPFVTVLTDVDNIENNYFLNLIFKIANIVLGIKSHQELTYFLGATLLMFLIFSIIFRAFVFFVQIRFIYMREYSIAKLLVENYLRQPYEWFLNRNSADIGKAVLSEASTVVHQGLFPLIKLISQIIFTSVIVTFLLIINFKLTLVSLSLIGGVYWVINKLSRKYINKIGSERLKANELKFISINETFNAVKEIKIGRLENIFINKFSIPSLIVSKNSSSYQIVSELPRYILEIVLFIGIIFMLLYIIHSTGSFFDALPIIVLYVFAGYRLMPSAQQIYSLYTTLKFSKASIFALYDDLKSLKKISLVNDQNTLTFHNKISLKNISYNYPNSSKFVLKNIDLTINVGEKIGLIGPTGSGKTTLINIVLGLLQPQQGTLQVDGQIIDKNNLRSWVNLISYVPQNIYLIDDTIANNIALGIDPANINQNILNNVTKIACLDKFVNNDLPNKFQTIVGENGIKLSGGQRQRIAIARALYLRPKVLILDEATSALDNQTESMVMDSVNNLSENLTIIMIAHRLSTLKSCDRIYKIENNTISIH